MRRLILILCCLTGVISGTSAAPAQYAFRVTFKDKQGAPPLSASPAWLSARAMARRGNFGISLDSTDRPVSALYVDSVLRLTQGVLHNTSRWLNQCVVLLTDSSKILQLSGKSFVGSVAWVGYFRLGLHMRIAKSDDPKFAVERPGFTKAKVTGSSTYYGATWPQTTMVNGDYLHDQGYRGEGKLIAMLDDGFAGADTHTGFDSLRRRGQVLETYNFKRNIADVYNDGSHGATCLSTIAGFAPGIYVGTAPNAQYAFYITEDPDFLDGVYELDNLIAGMERADSIGADVISASVVYNLFTSPVNDTFKKAALDGHTTIVARAVNMAVAKGIFYTSSAGNEGGEPWWNFLDSPGDADSALTIGAVTTSRAAWSLSSPGPNASGRVKPDVCLLGDQAAIFGGGNSVAYSSGTSFAAPQAAGYAACLMQAFPRAMPYQIRQAIVRSADHYTAPTPKLGYGIPDFKKVFQYLYVDGPNSSQQLEVRPNPFWQSFTVFLPAGALAGDISLLDAVGRNVPFTTENGIDSIIIAPGSSLPSGMYVLTAIVDGKRYVAKLIHW